MKRILILALLLTSCASLERSPEIKAGIYEYVDGVHLLMQIEGEHCALRITEMGTVVCSFQGTYTKKGRILKLKDKQGFKSEVEEDLYMINRCDLDYWKVTIVGEDSIQVGSFVLTRK